MVKIPGAVEEFLKCRINTCNELEPISLQSFNKVQYVREIVKSSLLDEIIPYYNMQGYQTNLGLYNLLVEPLKNAKFHVNSQSHNIEFSLILSPRALVAGYFDGGNYFRQEEIKKRWETKVASSDLIYVDTHIGKLYLGVSVMNHKFFSEIK